MLSGPRNVGLLISSKSSPRGVFVFFLVNYTVISFCSQKQFVSLKPSSLEILLSNQEGCCGAVLSDTEWFIIALGKWFLVILFEYEFGSVVSFSLQKNSVWSLYVTMCICLSLCNKTKKYKRDSQSPRTCVICHENGKQVFWQGWFNSKTIKCFWIWWLRYKVIWGEMLTGWLFQTQKSRQHAAVLYSCQSEGAPIPPPHTFHMFEEDNFRETM